MMILDAILEFVAPQARWWWAPLVVPLCTAPIALSHLDPGRTYQRSADRRLRLLCALAAACAVPACALSPDRPIAAVPAGVAVHLAVIAVLYRRKARTDDAHGPARSRPDADRTRPEGI